MNGLGGSRDMHCYHAFVSLYCHFEMVCVTARLAPSLPKPERPQRQGVRRESVENSLAAAAAKLSNMPVCCAVDPAVVVVP